MCLVATASAFLAFLAFGRPASLSGAQTIAYKQEGTFAYSAAAKDGFVYDKGGARTGQPVFLRLSKAVDVTFAYALKPEANAQVSGRVSSPLSSRTRTAGAARSLSARRSASRGRRSRCTGGSTSHISVR